MATTGDIKFEGVPYRINLSSYHVKDIVDFSPRASVSGGSSFMSDLGLMQPLVQTDWQHGFGFHWNTDSSGYMHTDGNVDTRQDGLAMLYTQSVSSDTNNNSKSGFTTFNGALYAWGAAGLRKYSGGSWTLPYSAAAVNYALATGDYLFFCPDGARIQKMDTSGTITDAGLDSSSTDYKWLVIHNGYIYAGKDGTNKVHYSSDSALADLEGTTADLGIIYCGLGNIPTIGAAVYAGILYIARQDGLWALGEDNIARRVIDYSGQVSANNFRSMVEINGMFIFPIRDRIVQWNGSRVADVTPMKVTDTFPYVTYGTYKGFVSVDNFLYCIGRTNETTYREHLLCWDGVGWHKLQDIVTNGSDSVTAMGYDVVNNYIWYHVDSTADATYYIQLQSNSSFPYGNFPTTGTHSLITSRMDMGFRRVQKSLTSLFVDVANVTANRYIKVYYALDGGSWTFWSNVTTNGTVELTSPGGSTSIQFTYIQFRFDFVTDSSAQSPILEGYCLIFIMRPDVRYGYSFDIVISTNLEYEGEVDTRTAADIASALRTLRDSKAPITLTNLIGESVLGYLSAIRENPVSRTLDQDAGTDSIEYIMSVSFVAI